MELQSDWNLGYIRELKEYSWSPKSATQTYTFEKQQWTSSPHFPILFKLKKKTPNLSNDWKTAAKVAES